MPDMNQNHSAPRREAQSSGKREAPKPQRRKRRRRPIVLTILIRFFQVLGTLLLIGVVTGSFMVCYAAVYVKTVVMPQTYLNLDEYTLNENSIIYYEDKDTGEWKELQTLSGDENREIIQYEDIPEDLINAFIAIEDKRFPTHQGVDWRRTASGLLRMFTGQSIQGGSTIDQQLIKNLTDRDDVTVNRKILEIFTALELENNYKKETILTVYFNHIYMGNKCYGVQAASQYYFGKDVWDLSLAECASLAGITNNPSLYAPYGQVDVVRYECKECGQRSNSNDEPCWSCGAENSYDNGSVWTNREFNKARQELILKEMAKDDISPNGAYITAAERDAAMAETLVFSQDKKQTGDEPEEGQEEQKKEVAPSSIYSWYEEAVIKDAINEVMAARNINWEAANQLVFNGGLKIYVPYDPDVQDAVDAIYNDRSNLDQVSKKTGQRLMSAITVVDNSTGYVVAIGNTMEKTLNRGLNPARDSTRQPGSSIKPLSVYSPALEMGLITPATVLDDSPQLLDGNIWPVNVSPTYKGLTTIQEGVAKSLNTIAVRTLQLVTPDKAYEYMTDVYGITSMEPYMVTSTGKVLSDINLSPLAMGGLTHGVSTYEMAAAFATFPRNGAFNKATTILEIKDSNDKTVVDNRGNTKFVIKPETAYYINSMLSNAVTSSVGTAGKARISGQTVAGKTGTTQDTCDYWFCGYSSYYTAAVWTGYNNREVINTNYRNPSIEMWQKVMAIVHEDLENKAFDVPRDLVGYNVCIDCGKLATGDCANDARGSRAQTFRLLSGDGPKEVCTCHVPIKVCMDSPILSSDGKPTGLYHLAGEFCPEESVKEVTMVNFERELAKPNVKVGDQNNLLSFYDGLEDPNCDVHTTEQDPDESDEPIDPVDPSVTDPPPYYTDPFIDNPTLPPTDEPTLPPVEPTDNSFINNPTLPPTDEPYIPVGDPEQDGWW